MKAEDRNPKSEIRIHPSSFILFRHPSSFSLAELLVVLTVSGLLFLALATFTRTSLTTTELLQNQDLAEQTARTALARLAREAALARNIAAAQTTSLAFTATDVTGDGLDDSLQYDWNSATRVLTRTLNGTPETFAENVTLFSLEYEYETENQVTIATPASTLPMTLAAFSGIPPGTPGYTLADAEADIGLGRTATQFFNNTVEVPAATSLTIRARTKILPPLADLQISLINDSSQTVATGLLSRSLLTATFQDITVPLTWIAAPPARMTPDKSYHLTVALTGGLLYAGTISYQTITSGPGLGSGLQFSYGGTSYGNTASSYFTVRGDLPVTTPRRATTPTSILKKIKATICVAEHDQSAQLSRTWKVINQ